MRSFGHRLAASTEQAELLALVHALGRRRDVHGILVQLPLPAALDARAVIEALPPEKDVDGLHPVNQGRLVAGEPGLRPCTPLGVLRLIDDKERTHHKYTANEEHDRHGYEDLTVHDILLTDAAPTARRVRGAASTGSSR